MNDITVTAHLDTDTTTRVVAFPNHDFVNVRIGGGSVDIVLMAVLGTADVLRAIATAATQAACELDALNAPVEVSA
ncbi:hypothetical protein ACFWOJ_06545 [Streptomyces sp. NPDC058439]|uniref:hypothetical protein n=1 Tax=Streptomyces sp. NPDC058439 TaxID=3346500 RepID=UPI0036510E44